MAAIPAVTWAQIRSRPLQFQILQVWDRPNSSLDQDLLLSQETLNSLAWWLNIENLSVGRPWRQSNLKILTTDASSLGWGAHIGGHYFQGRWDTTMTGRSFNYRELDAVFQALQVSKDLLRCSHVQVQSDNSTAVAYLNKQGGTSYYTYRSNFFSLAEEK